MRHGRVARPFPNPFSLLLLALGRLNTGWVLHSVWRSLVAHLYGVQVVGGSNPLTLMWLDRQSSEFLAILLTTGKLLGVELWEHG